MAIGYTTTGGERRTLYDRTNRKIVVDADNRVVVSSVWVMWGHPDATYRKQYTWSEYDQPGPSSADVLAGWEAADWETGAAGSPWSGYHNAVAGRFGDYAVYGLAASATRYNVPMGTGPYRIRNLLLRTFEVDLPDYAVHGLIYSDHFTTTPPAGTGWAYGTAAGFVALPAPADPLAGHYNEAVTLDIPDLAYNRNGYLWVVTGWDFASMHAASVDLSMPAESRINYDDDISFRNARPS